MDDVKVSVVVPIYNVEEYLDECLLSLKRQTLKEIEVLMIDDGSTDHSADIAKKYEKENPNFHYFYKENGGLGNARNYAIPYIKGDYLIFIDSDDIVPDYAYEKMYNLAVKTGNDLIIGNVKRFNSTKEWASNLHKKVFTEDFDHTHILDNPNLIYDTTSWNKLFKTSFYKENNFKFPEGILYEDIPVTIPAHFKANSVGVITDVCYMWRLRDGVSKSITQNRTEIKNFTDRIKIMDMVNEFYEKNITDDRALMMKDYKWLDIDLKLYINQMPMASDEYKEIAFAEIKRFLNNTRSDSFNLLRSIDKMKYFYIKNDDYDGLINLLNYQKTTFKSLRIKKEKDKYIGDFNIPGMDKSLKDMTKELEYYNMVQNVKKVNFQNNCLLIDCYFYISRLKSQKEFKYKAFLVNRDNNEKVEVSIVREPSKELTSTRGYRFCRKPLRIVKYNYSNCFYKIRIDLNDPKIMDILNGKCFIEIEYKNEIISKKFFIGNSNAQSEDLTQMIKYNGKMINTYLINQGYLQIQATHLYEISSVLTENNKLLLNSNGQDLFLSNNSYMSKLSKDGNQSVLDLTYLDLGKYFIKVNNDDKLITTSSANLKTCILNNNNLIIAENNNSGIFSINKIKNSFYLDELIINKNQVYFNIVTSIVNKDREYKLVLENTLYNYKIKLQKKDEHINGNTVQLMYSIDFNKETEIENFAQGNYKFYIEADSCHAFLLYGLSKIYKTNIVTEDRKFKFKLVDNVLTMYVIHEWKNFQNTKNKRRILKKYVYPLLRLLPIKKKYVIFEDWWGGKYHCNPKYLYKYIDTNYPEYKTIWFLNDNYIPITGNALRVRRKSLKYYYYLAVGNYFVNNVNFADEYEKRKGQIEIQTMHGTPLKTLGLDVPGEVDDPIKREKFLRRCNRWDYLVVQSDKASQITKSCYAFKKEFLRTGYPRNDILFEKNNKSDIDELKISMGIPTSKKVIMYAPTWRKRNVFDLKLDIEDMKNRLGNEYVLLLRIHPFAYAGFDDSMTNEFVLNFSGYESVEELYLVSDIVITDYSSVMFDYTILNRPILFYTYDLEEYRDFLRGFNFDFESEAPGPLIQDYDELIQSLLNINDVYEKYYDSLQKFRNKFNEYEKGTASKQIFDNVF